MVSFFHLDQCVTTKKWYPATTFHCPDKCPSRGPHFSGNMADKHNPHQYIACWHGNTVGCIACPKGLKYNEHWNACLYNGIYKTEPQGSYGNSHYYRPPTTTTTTTTQKPHRRYDPYHYNPYRYYDH